MNQFWKIHIDIDAFFASCIAQKYNLNTTKTPFAVVNIKTPRGIILSSNYLARKYDISAGMPIYKAIKNCPDLVFYKNDPQAIAIKSTKIFNYLKDNISKSLYQYSIDEWFVDLNNFKISNLNELFKILKLIKINIYNYTKLNVSIGCSFNYLLAKIATNYIKPDNICILPQANWLNKIGFSSLKLIPGIGEKTLLFLQKNKIYTFYDLTNDKKYNAKTNEFCTNLKEVLFKYENNILINSYMNFSPLSLDTNRQIHNNKSISFTKSVLYPIETEKDFHFFMRQLIYLVHLKAKNHHTVGDVIALSISTEKNRKIKQRQKTLKIYTNNFNTLCTEFDKLLEINRSFFFRKKITKIGVSLNNLKQEKSIKIQSNLFN